MRFLLLSSSSDMLRTRKKQKTIIESDDEYDLDAENDRDWLPDEDDDDDKIRKNRSSLNSNENDTSLPDDCEFCSTEGFQLKAVKTKKQSSHLIWTMFGHLMKDNKIVDKVKGRLYCIKCFEKERFKW